MLHERVEDAGVINKVSFVMRPSARCTEEGVVEGLVLKNNTENLFRCLFKANDSGIRVKTALKSSETKKYWGLAQRKIVLNNNERFYF